MRSFLRRHSLWFKTVSVAVIVSFLQMDILWASGGQVPITIQNPSLEFSLPEIPKEFGQIADVFKPERSNPHAPILYHIQDPHSVFQAQRNITHRSRHWVLDQGEKISAISIEGAPAGDKEAITLSITFQRKSPYRSIVNRFSLFTRDFLHFFSFLAVTLFDSKISLWYNYDRSYQDMAQVFEGLIPLDLWKGEPRFANERFLG